MTVYLDLTREFNAGELRAILTSGQAVVLHGLALMSKDGDWILREALAALEHVLRVLERRGARYRFGAPLDVRWMSGGWSAHFEATIGGLRVRTDFSTRPPRVPARRLAGLWEELRGRDPAFVDAVTLAEMKKTDREKDYAVIGELARTMQRAGDRLLYSRSARDLIALAGRHPAEAQEAARARPALLAIAAGRDRLEVELDAERRALMRANEERLDRYQRAASRWAEIWPAVGRELEGLPLARAHERMVEHALDVLPFRVDGGAP